ncbi:MAG: ATP-binding protein [Methanobacteriota archaeon]
MPSDALWDWNPWWNDPTRVQPLVGRPRDELASILPLLTDPKVLVISGVRRAGKTTIMYQLISRLMGQGVDARNILFLGLEDPAFISESLDSLLREYRENQNPKGGTYVFLDEVQSKDDWERVVRKELDLRRDCKFIVSGSSSTLIRGEYATLLTGRNLTHIVHPLSFRSYCQFVENEVPRAEGRESAERARALLKQYLEVGGFPEVVLQAEEMRRATLNQYFHDIVHRDIIHMHSADPRKVHAMASYLLMNVGNPVTLSSLRRALGLSYDAIRDYIQYLEQARLFYFVREFSFSAKPAPREGGKLKVYCTDVGMAQTGLARHSRDFGRVAENAVYLDMARRGLAPGFFRGKKEIDFVVVEPGRSVLLVNVCMSRRELPERELEGFREFTARYPRARCRKVAITDDIEGETEGVEMVPLWKWLLKDWEKVPKGK